ncbi:MULTISPECIES: GNAT family N-acetyltransferase [unclassified Lysobacter]|uniref:GNAT family N-acetyltransferase n=1 Tax=unclassified Lysobacter TaxID=2635362 RepID=UPI001BE52F22|nr:MULTISPECIES: GNAT family N-acetyltransferase [unclassified Lysobacter]MBT2747969.1 GNAT family N-acetyltransferase [Lysobacter sp. ISL-42]MBT2753691.1 GNAT family N-acetyltransferase [Lysobacter sp. ISL-50]MBT2779188.1 GNAT family N-acetyltransferase [Lysobacter sp. ISL-54]
MSSETPQFSIRRAGVADAATVADIATRTFVETFGALYPPEDLEFFLRDSYSIEKQAIILSHPDYAIFLLERDGVVVGHAAAGPCGLPHPQVAPGDGELKRLYLLREAQNGGWGARLFETVLEWLLRDGPRTLWIGVWSENFGAQRFYARYGFERVGEYEFIVGGTHDHEFILRRGAEAG